MAFWPYPSNYPVALDNYATAQIDNVDVVWANHPNSLSSSVAALQTKLNIANGLILGTGGLAFDSTGLGPAPPVAPPTPSLWLDGSSPGYAIMYTDETGTSYDLRNAASAGFIGYGFTCPAGMVAGELAVINGADTVTWADATTGTAASGMVINVYGGGTTCDIAYRAEVTGLA